MHRDRSMVPLGPSTGRCSLSHSLFCGGAADVSLLEIRRQLPDLLRRRAEAELGAAPQHILGGARPFALDEPAQLGLAETLPEIAAEIRGARRGAEDPVRVAAVALGEPRGGRGGEKRIAPGEVAGEPRDPTRRQPAAPGQYRA